MHRLITLACLLTAVVGIKEQSFGRIKALNGPVVTVFYNADVPEYEAALSVVEEVEKRVERFDFFKCDTKARSNARAAKQANLQQAVHVFVRTREDGIEEFRMPLTVANLVRYMRLRGVAGDPADVQQFTSEDALYELIDRTNQAVFVKAFEPWCAHCFKMKRGFEAGATFFKGRVHFMEVQCSASPAHEAFCDKMGAERLPTLSLFTGAKVLSFKGSRAVAAYELFFHQHRAELPAADMGVQPAFPVESLTLTPQEAALIGHGYPIREEDVGVPDSDSPIITEEINAARNAVLRDLAEEAMADATVAAAGGVTVDSPPADSSAKAPPPSPAAKPRKTSSSSLQAASQALFMAAATGPRGEVLSSSSNEDLQARVAHLEKMVDHLVHLHALQQASEEE